MGPKKCNCCKSHHCLHKINYTTEKKNNELDVIIFIVNFNIYFTIIITNRVRYCKHLTVIA